MYIIYIPGILNALVYHVYLALVLGTVLYPRVSLFCNIIFGVGSTLRSVGYGMGNQVELNNRFFILIPWKNKNAAISRQKILV